MTIIKQFELLLFLSALIGTDAFTTLAKGSTGTGLRGQNPTNTMARQTDITETHDSTSDVSLKSISRREALVSSLFIAGSITMPPSKSNAKDLPEDYRQGTAALANMDTDAPVPREAYKKLESGVVYADLIKSGSKGGSENIVQEGSRVSLEWVLRRSNGYFVDSSQVVGIPFIFTVGDGTAIAGVDEGVRGMQAGGVRRLVIPPRLAYVQGLEDGKPGPLPQGFGPRQQMRRVQNVRADVPGEYVFLEVQALRVR